MTLTPTNLAPWLGEARRVVAFCGAGVSAESGLPTFRGAGGLWEGQRVEDVATPEAFARDPGRVWRFYAARIERLAAVEPNAAHHVLAAMESRYQEFLLVSQNVDDLHERAGSRKLIKLHGSLAETRCIACGRVTRDGLEVRLADVESGRLPRCSCGGPRRPNVVWFGEFIDFGHLGALAGALRPSTRAGELLVLILGTSGEVSGGYGVAEAALAASARLVEINPVRTPYSDLAHLSIRGPAGSTLAEAWASLDN